jgi:glucosamine--fructose-6-phosphate aminotransferase (isomerizing)
MSFHSEILEQPDVLERLLSNQRQAIQAVAQRIKKEDVKYLFIAARGTSDNSARYAKYLFGIRNRIPVALAAPSHFTIYNSPPKLDGALVIGISQSGQSPDIVGVLAEGKRQGRPTLAITNAPDSPLAEISNFVIDIQAGKEAAVAASKTYTAQLMTLAMLSSALQGDSRENQVLQAVPGWARQALQLDEHIRQAVPRYRYMDQCVVLGRGYNYATAYEWSLKTKELAYVIAEPYSSADFQHGPVALVERGYPVLAVAPSGPVLDNMMELLAFLRQERNVELVVISDQDSALDLAQLPLRLPEGIPDWVSPIVSVIPGQLFVYHLTIAKGLDPNAPRGLSKVTETH